MSDSESTIVVQGRAGLVDLVAGELCLDFANTVEPRVASYHGGHPREYLASYVDLVEWCRHAGIMGGDGADRLLAEAGRQPDMARYIFEKAIGVREAIYRSFLAIASKKQPVRRDLDLLHTIYAQAIASARLATTDAGFDLVWSVPGDRLDYPLWPIARSAVELLMHGDPHRIKDCLTGGDGCGWLFYDTSKNNSRRWCSMRGCGNPAKERRRASRRAT
jgi:predicted RNA-binding Zn ribbon-like protein